MEWHYDLQTNYRSLTMTSQATSAWWTIVWEPMLLENIQPSSLFHVCTQFASHTFLTERKKYFSVLGGLFSDFFWQSSMWLVFNWHRAVPLAFRLTVYSSSAVTVSIVPIKKSTWANSTIIVFCTECALSYCLQFLAKLHDPFTYLVSFPICWLLFWFTWFVTMCEVPCAVLI